MIMKYLVTLFVFCLSISSFGQHLKTEPLELTASLSNLEYPNFKDHLNHIKNLKANIKPYALTIDELDEIRQGNFIISTRSLNKNFTFSNPPIIDLNKELRKVMLEIPGTNGCISARGFSL